MDQIQRFVKYKKFLNLVRVSIIDDKKFSLTRLINDNGVSDSSRTALYEGGFIKRQGYGKGIKYTWIVGEVTGDLTELFLEILKKLNAKNKVYKIKKEARDIKFMLINTISELYSEFKFSEDEYGNYQIRIDSRELSRQEISKLNTISEFSIRFLPNTILMIFFTI